MREIKFRQKLKPKFVRNGEEFHYWGYIDGSFVSPVGKSYSDTPDEQFTGLQGKGGVDVYDGDIFRFDWRYQSGELYASDFENIHGVVKHSCGRFVVAFFADTMQFDAHEINQVEFNRFWVQNYNSSNDEYFKMTGFEIIGNIHQNPELL